MVSWISQCFLLIACKCWLLATFPQSKRNGLERSNLYSCNVAIFHNAVRTIAEDADVPLPALRGLGEDCRKGSLHPGGWEARWPGLVGLLERWFSPAYSSHLSCKTQMWARTKQPWQSWRDFWVSTLRIQSSGTSGWHLLQLGKARSCSYSVSLLLETERSCLFSYNYFRSSSW